MPLFAIIPQSHEHTQLGVAIEHRYPNDSTRLDHGHGWMLVAEGTAQQLSSELGITDGFNDAAVVIQVSTYFGRANPNLWAWIGDHWGKSGG